MFRIVGLAGPRPRLAMSGTAVRICYDASFCSEIADFRFFPLNIAMNDRALLESIENLYRVFAKFTLAEFFYSPFINEEYLAPLFSKPLRDLSADDLNYYCFKAISTVGDENHFRHFLPRLCEITVQNLNDTLNNSDFDEFLIYKKLVYGNWQSWNEDEISALESFFRELTLYAIELNNERVGFTGNYLTNIADIVPDVTPYLNCLMEDPTTKKIVALKELVIDHDFFFSSCGYFYGNVEEVADKAILVSKIKQQQINDWLSSLKTVSTLETILIENEKLSNLPEFFELLEASYDRQKTK